MRFAFFILVIMIAFFGKGFAKEKMGNEFQVRFKPENISTCKEGVFLKAGEFGDVVLNNLRKDEKGHYTTCR